MSLVPRAALAELLDQHAQIRTLMARCEEIADALDEDLGNPADLARAVARLRIAFDAHNKCEEAYLRPVLIAPDPLAATKLDRMVDDHIREHRAVRDYLIDPSIQSLRNAIATLRTHLAEEEAWFLRDDAVEPATATGSGT